MRATDGRATSASTSNTVRSRSSAMLSARLMAVKVLPSVGRALVTITRLRFGLGIAPSPKALSSSGRLMWRNSSAIWLRSPSGVTMPAAARRSKSRLIREPPSKPSRSGRPASRLSNCSSLGAAIPIRGDSDPTSPPTGSTGTAGGAGVGDATGTKATGASTAIAGASDSAGSGSCAAAAFARSCNFSIARSMVLMIAVPLNERLELGQHMDVEYVQQHDGRIYTQQTGRQQRITQQFDAFLALLLLGPNH